MRKPLVIFLFLAAELLPAFGQGPPLNATAEQLFDAGMNAISGSSSNRNNFDAIEYFRRSAQKGYAPAQVLLGYLYDSGELVVGNASQAAEWYRKAAEQGDSLGQWLLGRLYFTGSGIPQDYASAQKWLGQSAGQGNPFGAYLLGRVMQDRDYTKAPQYFRQAAEQGLPQAQYHLARALKDGRGVFQDRFEAYVWFLIAQDDGYRATNDLSELEGILTSDQVDQAKTKARKLEETVSPAVVARGCAGWRGAYDDVPTPPPPKLQRFCR